MSRPNVTNVRPLVTNIRDENYINYLTIGDSITEGYNSTSRSTKAYAPLVNEQLKLLNTSGKANLSNQGKSGYKTSDYLSFMDQWRFIEHPALVTVAIGINDMRNGVSLATFETNYLAILDKVEAINPRPAIILCTTTYETGNWGTTGSDELNQQFMQKIKDIGAARGYEVCDFYAALQPYGDTVLDDQLHPNDQGHQILADALKVTIEQTLFS